MTKIEVTSRDLHEWQIELDRARKRAMDAEASLEAAEKRASEAERTALIKSESLAGLGRAYADRVAQVDVLRVRVAALEEGLAAAIAEWDRPAPRTATEAEDQAWRRQRLRALLSGAKPVGALALARLRALLSGEKKACGTCGGSGWAKAGTDNGLSTGLPIEIPCPACSASPGAGEKEG